MATVCLNEQAVRVENIFCIGRNYAAHIREMQSKPDAEMTVFMKPTSALLPAKQQIVLPSFSESLHFECEMVLLIGELEQALASGAMMDCVAGVGIGLDLTARDVQAVCKDKGLPWLKAKGFRYSACVSDFITPAQLGTNVNNVDFRLRLNGEQRQHGQTAKMLYPLNEMLQSLHEIYGLQAGDLVFTGTPEGVGELASGDTLDLDLHGRLQAQFTVA